MPMSPGDIHLLYIGNGNFNDNFINNGQFIYWTPAQEALGFAQHSPYFSGTDRYIAVFNMQSRNICGIYRFGYINESAKHKNLNNRTLLVRVVELNFDLDLPPGNPFGSTWHFQGIQS